MRFQVSGMTCDGCANAVRRAIGRVSPGMAVAVDVPGGKVDVSGDGDATAIARAIEGAGFIVSAEGAVS
ncbi:MAG TPA: heavy-metal-associated domain-containing protein [Stellaceae bacterium]|nr:heavy-metal-associated domain-containing protein [Stellaceae bacterium]